MARDDATLKGSRHLWLTNPENLTRSRLKELETLEKVTEKIGNLSVYGGLDSVLDNLVRLKR